MKRAMSDHLRRWICSIYLLLTPWCAWAQDGVFSADGTDTDVPASSGSDVVENIRFYEASVMLSKAGWVLFTVGVMVVVHGVAQGRDSKTKAWRAGEGIMKGAVVALVGFAVIYVGPLMAGLPPGLSLVTPSHNTVAILVGLVLLSTLLGYQERSLRKKQEQKEYRRAMARKRRGRTAQRDDFVESMKRYE